MCLACHRAAVADGRDSRTDAPAGGGRTDARGTDRYPAASATVAGIDQQRMDYFGRKIPVDFSDRALLPAARLAAVVGQDSAAAGGAFG